MKKIDKASTKDVEMLSDIELAQSISRRNFFRKAAVYSASAVAATSLLTPTKLLAEGKGEEAILEEQPWATSLGAELNKNPYGVPSPYEHNVVRRTTPLLSSAGDMHAAISVTPLQDLKGIITPNGLFFTRTHNGVASIDYNKHRLMIHGMLKKPIVLTMDDIKRYPSESVIHFMECPSNGAAEWKSPQFDSLQFIKGMMSCTEWTGVKLKTILADLGVDPKAIWMLAEGGDGSSMSRTIPMEKVMDDAMIVYAMNGEALREEQGYPIRLFVPGWEANLSVKWLKRLEFGDKPWYCKEETSKYTTLLPSGKAIQHFYPLEVNSIVTSPCPEKPWTDLKKGDIVEIEGLAWSGKGTITHVDLSFDGGKNWVETKLKGLVLPKAWTRFSYMYKYEGKDLLLESRAVDDSGDVQPTVNQEKSVIGVEGVYHRNSINTWAIKANGEVHNAQMRS